MMLRQLALVSSILFGVGVPLFCVAGPLRGDEPQAAEDGPVFELRTYTANPGKMADLHKRFRDHTMRLFEKHGMKNIGYWVPTDKPNTLVYILQHKSRAAADRSWSDFQSDPEWKKVYKESHKNGILVKVHERVYMKPTDYSPLK